MTIFLFLVYSWLIFTIISYIEPQEVFHMDAQKLEQIQKVFANDRFATDNGAVIEQVDEGYAK